MTTPQDPYSTPPESTKGGARAPPEAVYGSPPAGQAAYGQPAYGQPPYGQQGVGPGGSPKNGLGVAALVLGILALVTSLSVIGGVLLGLLAIILGIVGRGRAKRGEANNGGMALAGIILGVLGLLISVALVAVGASFFTSDTGRQLVQCLGAAGDDQAAQQQCRQGFGEDVTG